MSRLSCKCLLMGGIVLLALAVTAPRADARSWGSAGCYPPSSYMGWCSGCYGCCDCGCCNCWRSWWGVGGYVPWNSPAWGCGASNCGCMPMVPAAPAKPTAAPPATPVPAVPTPLTQSPLPADSK
jgi:uncharacterized membrane protein